MAISTINNYDKIARLITKTPIQAIIRKADKNPALFQSGVVFTMASIIRPATINITPAKTEADKQDRIYSACKSIASGITDLVFSTLLFVPANKAIDKFTENLIKDINSSIFNDINAAKMYKTLLNRGLKIATIPMIAFFNFRYLKSIVNFLTGKKNENKQNQSKLTKNS